MLSAIKVLNTVTTLGADAYVTSSGDLNFGGLLSFPARYISDIQINTSVAETQGVVTITPTAADATTYTFYITGASKATGLPKTMVVSFVSATGATATTITTQAKTIINADTDFSVAATGTSTIVLTSASGYPVFFRVGGSLANIDSISGTGATTIFTNLSAANGTPGKQPIGTGALLQAKYAYAAQANVLGYSTLSTLTSTSYYTEVVISYNDFTPGNGVFLGTVATKQAVLLVLYGTSAQGTNTFSSSTTANYSDLLGTYGTITGLAAGYQVVLSAPATTTAAIATATGVATLAGGSTTFLTLEGLSGDYLYLAADTTTNTGTVARVLSPTAAATALTPVTTTTGGSIFKYAKWRSLPF